MKYKVTVKKNGSHYFYFDYTLLFECVVQMWYLIGYITAIHQK